VQHSNGDFYGAFVVFKIIRFTRRSDVQDVEPKVGIEPSMASVKEEPN
jgi:hypothetical protein